MSDIIKQQKIIVMKSRLPIWIDADRALKLEAILESNSGHKFVKIDGELINSAEMDGVYTFEKYSELQKIKQGHYQCVYKKWHARKEECTCKADIFKQLENDRHKREQDKLNEPISEEQRQKNLKKIREIREEFIGKGLWKIPGTAASGRVSKLKRSALIEYKKRHGLEYKVPSGTEIIEDVEPTDSG